MKILGPCGCRGGFPVTSSRWAGLPTVHVRDSQDSIWHGYDGGAAGAILESLLEPGPTERERQAEAQRSRAEAETRAQSRRDALALLGPRIASGTATPAEQLRYLALRDRLE